MPRRNLLLLLLTVAISYACYVRGEQNPYARYVADGLATIQEESLEAVPSRELFSGAMEGMVGVLRRHGDEHSQFVPEEEADPLRSEIHQQFGGIGVRIGFEGGHAPKDGPPRLVIVDPPNPDTPAARANLLPGDVILRIDDHLTEAMTMADVLRHMRGQPGTKVRLTIQHEHEEQPRTVELIREVIDIESILGDRRRADGGWEFRLESDPRLAHVRIALFGDRTAIELQTVLNQLVEDGILAVVLDMRDNSGGSLDAAVAVCELLLPARKTIVETRGRDGVLLRRYVTKRAGKYVDVPLAVLVNQNSASAAEIVAACLQDHGRATVVGERTYGKGTVQQLLPLESGRSLLKLTWASFWRPSGEPIHRLADSQDQTWGVAPESGYEHPLTPEEYAAYRQYRSQRDLVRPRPSAGAGTDDEHATSVDFIDEQLQLALKQLQGQ